MRTASPPKYTCLSLHLLLFSPPPLFSPISHHHHTITWSFSISFSFLPRWPSRERERERMGGGSLKAMFHSIAFMVLLGFLLVGILAYGGTPTSSAVTSASIRSNFKHFRPLGREGPIFNAEFDPNYMSKRRVPNGPDPIHNRGSGKSRQPPGKSYP